MTDLLSMLDRQRRRHNVLSLLMLCAVVLNLLATLASAYHERLCFSRADLVAVAAGVAEKMVADEATDDAPDGGAVKPGSSP